MLVHVELVLFYTKTITSKHYNKIRLSNYNVHTYAYLYRCIFSSFSCTDIDECQYTIDPVCSQKCINTIGSFQCSCINGYILRPDLRTCKALGGAVKLIMANRVDIRQVSLSNNRYTSIVKGLHNAIALDFHYKRSLLFWSDVSKVKVGDSLSCTENPILKCRKCAIVLIGNITAKYLSQFKLQADAWKWKIEN